MVWVRSEYAGELAVLSAWIAALLPWNIMYSPEVEGLGGSTLFVRFPFVQIRYIFGVPAAEAVTVDSPVGAQGLVEGSVELAYDAWMLGAVLVALAVLLSIAMYLADGLDEHGVAERDVRALGRLVGAGSVVIAAAALALDVGMLYVWFLGTAILTVAALTWFRANVVEGGDEVSEPADGEHGTDGERATDGSGAPLNEADERAVRLVAIGTVALSTWTVFVTADVLAVAPSRLDAAFGVDLPAAVEGLVLLGIVAVMIGGVLSLADEILEREQPALTVRVMGGLLGLGAVVLVGSTVLFATRGIFGGIPVPLGLLVMLPLAGTLLVVDLE